MESAATIRNRIKTVEQTQKITGAMELVATVRTKSVLSHIEYSRKYHQRLQAMIKEILLASQNLHHPFLDPREGGHKTFLVLGADRGMCGSYNSALFKFAMEKVSKQENYAVITLGKMPALAFHAKGIEPVLSKLWASQGPTLHRARHLMEKAVEMFLGGETDQVHVIYTSFYGETRNKPVMQRLLPLLLTDYTEVKIDRALREVIYHPTPQELFDDIVPQCVESLIFSALSQAYASENLMRMTAMKSAKENAEELLKKLKIHYNLARQTAITEEITEISGANEILLQGGEGL